MAGFPDRDAIWLATIPAFGNFIFTILGLLLVDRIGRRKLLLGSSAGVSSNRASLKTTLAFRYTERMYIRKHEQQQRTSRIRQDPGIVANAIESHNVSLSPCVVYCVVDFKPYQLSCPGSPVG